MQGNCIISLIVIVVDNDNNIVQFGSDVDGVGLIGLELEFTFRHVQLKHWRQLAVVRTIVEVQEFGVVAAHVVDRIRRSTQNQ